MTATVTMKLAERSKYYMVGQRRGGKEVSDGLSDGGLRLGGESTRMQPC